MRTIREFVLGVVLVPTCFSILWFGVLGGIGFFTVLHTDTPILDVVVFAFVGALIWLYLHDEDGSGE